MKKALIQVVVFFFLFFSVRASFATPPVSIDLSYDQSKGVLHVEAVHPSFNLEKSYVRLMNVYLNGQQVTTVNYYKQNDYNKFSDDVSMSAQIGDVIKVELFCSLGGDMSKELTVNKPQPQSQDQKE